MLQPEIESNLVNEPIYRLNVVGDQHKIEQNVINSSKGAAVFFVQTCLTPLYIPMEAVTQEGDLYVLKKEAENAIPDGLIPEIKLKDAKQLSTVLARVITVNEMLKKGVNIVIFHQDEHRAKTNSQEELVDDKQVTILKALYPDNLKFQTITPNEYTNNKALICAASYCYLKDGKLLTIGIDASQIQNHNSNHPFSVSRDEEASQKIDALNLFLESYQLPSIAALLHVQTISQAVVRSHMA